MTEKLTRETSGAVDGIIAEMRRGFLDDAADTLRNLELSVEDADMIVCHRRTSFTACAPMPLPCAGKRRTWGYR